jgi:hypothetical protein
MFHLLLLTALLTQALADPNQTLRASGPAAAQSKSPRTPQQPPAPTKQLPSPKAGQVTRGDARAAEFEEFQRKVEGVIKTSEPALENNLEATDLQTLKFLLPKLAAAIKTKDWKAAAEYRKQMNVAITREQVVAADADRRITERKKAEQQQRQKEEKRQRERQQRKEMKGLQNRWNQWREQNNR